MNQSNQDTVLDRTAALEYTCSIETVEHMSWRYKIAHEMRRLELVCFVFGQKFAFP